MSNTNEEEAAETLLQHLIEDPTITEALQMRVGVLPEGSDEAAQDYYATQCSLWYGHVLGLALSKLQRYEKICV